MPWYYANNNQRRGPVSDTEFARLAREEIIREDTWVWQHGMPDWRTYAEVVPTLPAQELPPPLAGEAAFKEATAILANQPVELNYAGFWVRAGAKIIDLIILNILVMIVAELMNKMPAAPVEGSYDEMQKFMSELVVLTRISVAINLVYTWLFVWQFQATPGKLIFGLKIVRADGSRLGHGVIILRYMAEFLNQMLFGIGYFLAVTDGMKRTMHDFICNTRVVKKNRW